MGKIECPDREQLVAYVLGKLPEQVFEAVARHVATCASCENTVAGLDSADDTLLAGLRQKPDAEPFAAEPELKQAAEAARKMGPPAPPVSTVPLQPGEKRARPSLGKYRLLSRLGQGGMGTVYKALHTELQKLVALKVLAPHLVQDRQAVARFRREMKAVGRLEHANLVRAMDAGQAGGRHFLVVEYVEGPTLGQLVRRLGRLPVPEACELIRQAALGLQYVYEQGMVHRDVKPSNLILTREGTVKVLDLGLALLAADETSRAKATDSGMALGTADYIAPEQVNDSHNVDIRADIYSLGCTLYELLTGRAPFAGPEHGSRLQRLMAHVQQPLPPVRQFRPELPEELVAVLECMLAKAPEDRYSQPREVVEALRPFCAGARPARLFSEGAEGRGLSAKAAPPPLRKGETKMSPSNAGWYLTGAGNQRQGPFNTEQIIQAWQEGRVAEETPCTRQGMSGWMPLYQVEPFATVIRGSSVHGKKRGGLLRVVVVLACAGCLGAVGFFGWREYERRQLAAVNGPDGKPAIASGGDDRATTAAWESPEQGVEVIRKESTPVVRVELCQTFLQQFPQSPQAPEVMTIVVRDVPEAFQGAEKPDEAAVQRVTDMAQELIEKHAKQEGASQAVFKLVNWLEKESMYDQAAKTGEQLQQQLGKGEADLDPDAAMELPKIVNRCWDQHIEKELKVEQMVDPAFVYALKAKPNRCHVVSVHCNCVRSKFQTDELELLISWVRRGGILWADNDILNVFGISHTHHGYGGLPPSGVCDAATSGDVCPILAGCSKVLASARYDGFGGLSSGERTITLLSFSGTRFWSVVPFGKGWVSDLKTVDTSQYDGARFWRNFRRFCLGEIPPRVEVSPEPSDAQPDKGREPDKEREQETRPPQHEPATEPEAEARPPEPKVALSEPSQPDSAEPVAASESSEPEKPAPAGEPAEPPQEPTIVSSKQQLEEALAANGAARVLWVQLTASETSASEVAALGRWVDAGGVLWLDTDLGKEFGFPLMPAHGTDRGGKAAVLPVSHPATKDLPTDKPVLFFLDEGRQLIVGKTEDLVREMTPLVGWEASRTRAWVVCAVRARGKGHVVFRPREFNDSDDASRQFAVRLVAWSFSVARPPKGP